MTQLRTPAAPACVRSAPLSLPETPRVATAPGCRDWRSRAGAGTTRRSSSQRRGMPHLEARSRNSLRARPWHAGAQLPAPRPTVRLILPPPSRRIRARRRGLRLACLLHTGPLIHRRQFDLSSLLEPTNLKSVAFFNFNAAHTGRRRFLVCKGQAVVGRKRSGCRRPQEA